MNNFRLQFKLRLLSRLRFCNIHCIYFFSFFRYFATAAQSKEKDVSHPKENLSFTMNIFRGQIQATQVFPYPDVLNEEQRETIEALIDPVEKFFAVNINF